MIESLKTKAPPADLKQPAKPAPGKEVKRKSVRADDIKIETSRKSDATPLRVPSPKQETIPHENSAPDFHENFGLTRADLRDFEHSKMYTTFTNTKRNRTRRDQMDRDETDDHDNPFLSRVRYDANTVNTRSVCVATRRIADFDHPQKLSDPETVTRLGKSK